MGRLVLITHRVPAPGAPRTPSGLVTTVAPAAEAAGALWMGWSGQIANSRDLRFLSSAGGNIRYALLDMSAEEHRRHYLGFCNRTLWPLLHALPAAHLIDPSEYLAYRAVNRRFACALAPLLRADDRAWVHDYHLLPLGAELRALGVRHRIGYFLHTPAPELAAWQRLPAHDDLAESLRAYDLLGVQTPSDAERMRALLRDNRHGPRVAVFPASIPTRRIAALAARTDSAPKRIVLGVDRLDPAKGIDCRIAGFDAFLRHFPEQRGGVRLLQVIPESRGELTEYRALHAHIDALAAAVNASHAKLAWAPIRTLHRNLSLAALIRLYRLAPVALLTPLRDGMNLVAKEYVAAQNPSDPGVLVLSRHAGAAHELSAALLVDPDHPNDVAQAIQHALTLPRSERIARWSASQQHLLTHDALAWARDFLRALAMAPTAARPYSVARRRATIGIPTAG